MIIVVCEGKTEAAIKRALHDVLQLPAPGARRTALRTIKLGGRIKTSKTRRLVAHSLADAKLRGIVVLTDVYPDYADGAEAKKSIAAFLGDVAKDSRVRIHAAQFELEAWLLPFWGDIARSLGVTMKPPGAQPEKVNHTHPPSRHLADLFGRAKRRYDKVIDAAKWLTADRLRQSAELCPELKAFLNSLTDLATGPAAG